MICFSCKPDINVSAVKCILIYMGLVPICPCVAVVGWIISVLCHCQRLYLRYITLLALSFLEWNFSLD